MWDLPPFTTEVMISILSLTLMEIVLGIDNVIFLAIVVGKLPPERQKAARVLGLGLALVARLGLLFTLSWIMGLTKPLFTVPLLGAEMTGKSLILVLGGLFLMGKAVFEIHEKLESEPGDRTVGQVSRSLGMVVLQVALLDIVFSLDSVISAVGMAPKSSPLPDGQPYLWVIVVAIVATVVVMLFFAAPVGKFVDRHPTLKMLALSFLLLIGFLLVAEGIGKHIPKGYVYFAMAFSLGVEMMNMRLRKVHRPVQLHEPPAPGEAAPERSA